MTPRPRYSFVSGWSLRRGHSQQSMADEGHKLGRSAGCSEALRNQFAEVSRSAAS